MTLFVEASKQFPDFKLDVSFSLRNELTVLFGPSGSGKSLTLKMIAGLVKPDKGRIVFKENVMFDSLTSKNIKPQSRSIGYVFQNQSVFPHMTVRENILFGARGLTTSEASIKTTDILKEFNLEDQQYKYPREISGGQQQRVAIAMGVIRTPQFLLLDEPFSALDFALRQKMRNWLRELKDKLNIPVILVTHDHEEARTIADKILYYDNGSIKS